MKDFAEYILNEQDLASKMEIAYYLSKKSKIFFDKSVVLKTEIARLFLNYSKIEVDNNLVLTACLLCNCKKVDNAQDLKKVHTYAIEGAEYLRNIGFGKRFCKICEEVNRYSNSNPRERESDILELVDQFGAMLLDRSERLGFKPDEAIVMLERRNFKDIYNRYLNTFIEFVNFIEQIEMNDIVDMTAFRRLVKIYNETDKVTKFMDIVLYEYEPKIDNLIKNKNKQKTIEMLNKVEDANRPLFSKETTRKFMANINGQNGVTIGKEN